MCVSACVRVYFSSFSVVFFHHGIYLFHNLLTFRCKYFTCPPSRWQCQCRSCSRSSVQDQSPLAHNLPLPRSHFTSIYTRSTDKHPGYTSTHFTQSPGVMHLMPSSISSVIAVYNFNVIPQTSLLSSYKGPEIDADSHSR